MIELFTLRLFGAIRSRRGNDRAGSALIGIGAGARLFQRGADGCVAGVQPAADNGTAARTIRCTVLRQNSRVCWTPSQLLNTAELGVEFCNLALRRRVTHRHESRMSDRAADTSHPPAPAPLPSGSTMRWRRIRASIPGSTLRRNLKGTPAAAGVPCRTLPQPRVTYFSDALTDQKTVLSAAGGPCMPAVVVVDKTAANSQSIITGRERTRREKSGGTG